MPFCSWLNLQHDSLEKYRGKNVVAFKALFERVFWPGRPRAVLASVAPVERAKEKEERCKLNSVRPADLHPAACHYLRNISKPETRCLEPLAAGKSESSSGESGLREPKEQIHPNPGFILQCLLHYGSSVPQATWLRLRSTVP